MLIYVTQSFTDGSAYNAGSTYDLQESIAGPAIQRGQAQMAENLPFYSASMRNVGSPTAANTLASTKKPTPLVFAQSAVAVPLTGTTAETVLASVVIPGGLMGPNGAVRVSIVDSHTNNTNLKILKIALAASVLGSVGINTSASGEYSFVVRNRGTQIVQVSGGINNFGSGVSGNSAVTSTVNTAVDQTLTITGTLAVGTDTLTLEAYTVEVLPGF